MSIGFEKLIGSHQARSVLDQIYKDRISLWCQQDAFVLPCIAVSPETLVHGIEREGGNTFIGCRRAPPAWKRIRNRNGTSSERPPVQIRLGSAIGERKR
jgi:hypothetical protein